LGQESFKVVLETGDFGVFFFVELGSGGLRRRLGIAGAMGVALL
jgi:hypothetical protein